jgi:hypothetical protein
MKKTFLLLIILSLFLFACNQASEEPEPVIDVPEEPSYVETETFIPMQLSVYRIEPDSEGINKNTFVETLSRGEPIVHLNTYVSSEFNSSPREFALIRYDEGEKEGYVLSDWVLPNGKLGVTREDAVLYSDNDSVAATSTVASRLMLFAYDPDESDERFLFIKGRDEFGEAGWIRGSYIKRADASLNATDVEVARLFITAEKNEDPTIKEALLSDALAFQNSIFFSDVQAAMGSEDDTTEESVAVIAVDAEGTIARDNVIAYEIPDTGSTTVAVLRLDEPVLILLQTESTEEVNGVDGPWLQIQTADLVEGWVHSSNIAQQ